MSITEFLLARIAEDEEVARDAPADATFYKNISAQKDDWGLWVFNVPPHRFLAECKAKREIVERYAYLAEHGDSGDARWVLPLLAQPYADHPDFDPEWRA